MKVKLTKDQLVGPDYKATGDVVDVNPRRAEQMIRDKAAERAEPVDESEVDSPPDEASRRETFRRTGRPARTGPPELTGEIDPAAPAPGESAIKVGSTETAEVVANPDGSLVQVAVEETDPAGNPTTVESARPSGRGRPARNSLLEAADPKPEDATPSQPVNAPKGERLGPGDAK